MFVLSYRLNYWKIFLLLILALYFEVTYYVIILIAFVILFTSKIREMSISESERQRKVNHLLDGQEKKPVSYFNLVERVGDSGRYQLIILVIFIVCWFVTGVILLNTAFLFRQKSFDCRANGLLIGDADCNDYVCKLPKDQAKKYFSTDDNSFQSIATKDQYLCENSATLDLVSSCTYFGAFIGYIAISFFSDNFGRRTSMLLAWAVCTVGTILVATSVNIYMVAVGLFFSGCGCDAAINICFFFFGQVVGDKKRQEYSVLVQIFFTLAAMLSTLFYYLVDNWRYNWISLVTVPTILALLLIFFFVEETPQFLVKKGIVPTLKALNRIGRINGKGAVLQERDIIEVMQSQITEDFKDKYITPIDLCRFPSLRFTTITLSIIFFMTYAMYYGPTLIIDDIGFNIYISSFMVNLSELVMFVPAYFFIEKIYRRSMGIKLFSIAVVMSLILVFLEKPEQCDDEICFQSIIQLILIFIFRGSVSFFFCFFQLYSCQLYPGRARGMGVGIVSSVGTLASTSSPIYLGFLRRKGINVMNFFMIFGIIAIGNLTLLRETKGEPMQEEIEEIQMEKDKRRSSVFAKASRLFVGKSDRSLLSSDKLKSSRTSHKD